MKWYERQVEWEEDHDYRSVKVCSPLLQSWFLAMKEDFPPMNGEFSPEPDQLEDFESRTADYSFGREMIYAGFAWSAAGESCALAKSLAHQFGLGFLTLAAESFCFHKALSVKPGDYKYRRSAAI